MNTYRANLFELQGFTDPKKGDWIETRDFRTMYNIVHWYARIIPPTRHQDDFIHCDILKNGEHYATVSYFHGACAIATNYTCGLMISL